MAATKIATCCYCGTKAALVLRGKDKHELTCSNCGAPLRAMKMLPAAATANHPIDRPVRPAPQRQQTRPQKKQKKRKSFKRKVLSNIWDAIEDVVDEVFD